MDTERFQLQSEKYYRIVSFFVYRSINGGRFRSSLRHQSNRNSSNGGSSSGTIGGGLSDIYFGNEDKLNSIHRKENSGKFRNKVFEIRVIIILKCIIND